MLNIEQQRNETMSKFCDFIALQPIDQMDQYYEEQLIMHETTIAKLIELHDYYDQKIQKIIFNKLSQYH